MSPALPVWKPGVQVMTPFVIGLLTLELAKLA